MELKKVERGVYKSEKFWVVKCKRWGEWVGYTGDEQPTGWPGSDDHLPCVAFADTRKELIQELETLEFIS